MKSKLINASVLFVVIATVFCFGFTRVEKFSGGDETLWSYGRIPDFWNGIKNQKWKNTNINDKPGITLALVSGAGLPFAPNPKEYKNLTFQSKSQDQLNSINSIYYSLRLPVFILFLISIPIFYFLIKKLLTNTIACFSIIFIGLSPLILGISLILNPDALLWIFLPLATISYLIFLKEESRKYLYLSGFFLGLALLTKYVANILYVYFFSLIFLDYIFNSQKQLLTFGRYLKKSLIDYGLLVFISMLTFFALFPATWVDPKILLKGTILSQAFNSTWPIFVGLIFFILFDSIVFKSAIVEKIIKFMNKYRIFLIRITSLIFLALIFFVLLDTYWGMKFYDLENILNWPKRGASLISQFNAFAGDISADTYSLIFGITPVVFFFFFLALIKNLKLKKNIFQENTTVFYLSFFILFYYFASTVNGVVAIIRYQIVLYPLSSIIAAIGLEQFLKWEKIKKYLLGLDFYLPAAIIFIISLISLFSIRPFYFCYASSLLPKQYTLNMLDMGDGSWEISQYLNDLPNAKNINIWTDKKQVCEKFIGNCSTGLKSVDSDIKFDYFVASQRGKEASLSYLKPNTSQLKIGADLIDLSKLYSGDNYYDFKIIIGNRIQNYIKVASFKKVSPEN